MKINTLIWMKPVKIPKVYNTITPQGTICQCFWLFMSCERKELFVFWLESVQLQSNCGVHHCSTYCSSRHPAGQWYKRPTSSRRSRDTWCHSTAPSRATIRMSRIRIQYSQQSNNLTAPALMSMCLYLPFLSQCTSPLSGSIQSYNIDTKKQT